MSDVNFLDNLMTLLGMEKERIDAALNEVDIDQLSFLVDAVARKDKETANQIMGAAIQATATDVPETKVVSKKKPEGEAASKGEKPKEEPKTKPKLRKASNLNVGDEIKVDKSDATVKHQAAHGDTVGVMIDGGLKMVNKKDIKKNTVKENADLSRILQLAGLPVIEEEEVMDNSIEDLDYNEEAPVMGDEGMDDAGVMGDMEMGADAGMDDMVADLPDMGFGDAIESEVVDGEVPADAPVAGMETDTFGDVPPAIAPAPVAPIVTPAPALGGIEAAIAQVEAEIPNCKLSEFKALVARLEGLLATAKNQGRAALAEHRAIRNEMKKSLLEAFADEDDDDLLPSFDDDDSDFDFDLDQYARQSRRTREDDMFEAVADDEDDFLLPVDDEDDIDLDAELDSLRSHSRNSRRFEEGKLHTKEDALDIDGDGEPEPEDKNSRKTLLDYVNETEEEMTIGNNQNDAMKNIQARMGPKATPQDAKKAMDAMRQSKVLTQNGSKFQMPAMSDDELNGLLSGDDNNNTNNNGVTRPSGYNTGHQS